MFITYAQQSSPSGASSKDEGLPKSAGKLRTAIAHNHWSVRDFEEEDPIFTFRTEWSESRKRRKHTYCHSFEITLKKLWYFFRVFADFLSGKCFADDTTRATILGLFHGATNSEIKNCLQLFQ